MKWKLLEVVAILLEPCARNSLRDSRRMLPANDFGKPSPVRLVFIPMFQYMNRQSYINYWPAVKSALLLCMICCLLVGCGPAGPGPGNIRLKRPVTTEQAVGVWKLREECLARLVKKEGYRAPSGAVHELELRRDGTCHFRSLLQSPTRYVDCEGTWRLTPEGEKTTTLALSLSLKEPGGYALALDFTELFGKVELFHYWGDPDACDILRFEKKGQLGGSANGSQPLSSETNRTPPAADSRR